MLNISERSQSILTLSLIALTWIAFWHAPAMAVDEINKTYFGVAIKGYDTVAYFTENRAIEGNQNISHIWNDAKWYFASEQNRDLFAADPEKYAPQFGGHWPAALSAGKVAGVNPENFKIIDGKLYLAANKGVDIFAKKPDMIIKKADSTWAQLMHKK